MLILNMHVREKYYLNIITYLTWVSTQFQYKTRCGLPEQVCTELISMTSSAHPQMSLLINMYYKLSHKALYLTVTHPSHYTLED